jgi:hypothetical protein
MPGSAAAFASTAERSLAEQRALDGSAETPVRRRRAVDGRGRDVEGAPVVDGTPAGDGADETGDLVVGTPDRAIDLPCRTRTSRMPGPNRREQPREAARGSRRRHGQAFRHSEAGRDRRSRALWGREVVLALAAQPSFVSPIAAAGAARRANHGGIMAAALAVDARVAARRGNGAAAFGLSGPAGAGPSPRPAERRLMRCSPKTARPPCGGRAVRRLILLEEISPD